MRCPHGMLCNNARDYITKEIIRDQVCNVKIITYESGKLIQDNNVMECNMFDPNGSFCKCYFCVSFSRNRERMYPLRRNDYQNNSINIFYVIAPGLLQDFPVEPPVRALSPLSVRALSLSLPLAVLLPKPSSCLSLSLSASAVTEAKFLSLSLWQCCYRSQVPVSLYISTLSLYIYIYIDLSLSVSLGQWRSAVSEAKFLSPRGQPQEDITGPAPPPRTLPPPSPETTEATEETGSRKIP